MVRVQDNPDTNPVKLQMLYSCDIRSKNNFNYKNNLNTSVIFNVTKVYAY